MYWLKQNHWKGFFMRPQGKTKLAFFPLPIQQAKLLRHCLEFDCDFAALDPCVGDGVAFTKLLEATHARRYGIEIDANRAEQARQLGIETLQANTMDVRCPAESISLLYLNPPYDFEVGRTNNQRLELVFLEHTYRWLKPGGILVFVIPQPQLKACARTLSEHFADLTVYRLTEPESVRYKQVAVLGRRRKRIQYRRDSALLESLRWLESLALIPDLQALTDVVTALYEVPPSDRSYSRTLAFHWMKSRMCYLIPPHIARRVESCSRNSGTSKAGHSRHCMAATLGCCARLVCSTGYSGRERIDTSLIGGR